MRPEIAREVIRCLPSGRTLFPYSKDDYAFHLLRLAGAREKRIHKLRKTTAGKLLEKPVVKRHLATCPSGLLEPELLPESNYTPDARCYRLSLDIWGGERKNRWWQQVSRCGASLVLQLNLNHTQAEMLRSCYVSETEDPFENYGHPARSGDFPTLAWARMDFDLETGEALIEELQTDLLRDLKSIAESAYEADSNGLRSFERYGADFDVEKVIRVWEAEYLAERSHWQEAMLSAAIRFLATEIGSKEIYYHTEHTGAFLKRISGTRPPRSLYTDLPRRFCFDETDEVPRLLSDERDWRRREKAARDPIRFFKMAV